ncbi:MAG: Veg family protein [Bacilli bacterium]|nr:Veg family protein [Bacilli bacterium]
MTIESVKQELNKHLGENVIIKHNLGRNKYEQYDAIIKEIYNCIFIVESKSKERKSFSYTDIITKIIKIEF